MSLILMLTLLKYSAYGHLLIYNDCQQLTYEFCNILLAAGFSFYFLIHLRNIILKCLFQN